MHGAIRILAAGLCLAFVVNAPAATQWHMPTPYPDGEHHTRNIRLFAADVEAATGGNLEIVVHSGASLFKHPEIHRAVRSGQVPIGEMLMGLLGNDAPLFKVDNIPFLATDFTTARRLWHSSRPYLEKSLEKQGLVLLFAVPWPPQGLYARLPVASVTEFAGKKLRAYSPLTARLAMVLGAAPVNVQTPEIPQAFSTGIIDLMFTSPSTGVSSQAWDYTRYYIDTRAWIPKNMVIVNRRAFRRLPKPQQDALLAAAAAAETRGWRMAEQETRDKTRTLEDNGMTVMPPTENLQKELRAIGATLAGEWVEETGSDGRAILDAMKD